MKKHLTRALFFLVMVALMMPAGVVVSASTGNEISIGFPGVDFANAANGDTVTARVRFESLTLPVVGNFFLTVNYDTAALNVTSFRVVDAGGHFSPFVPAGHSAGSVEFGISGPAPFPRPEAAQERAEIVEVVFTVANAAAFNANSATLALSGNITLSTPTPPAQTIPFTDFTSVPRSADPPNALSRVSAENVSLRVGQTANLQVGFLPTDAVLAGAEVEWSSNSASVAVAPGAAPGTTATVTGVAATPAGAPATVTAQLRVGGANVPGATQTFNVSVSPAGDLVVVNTATERWGRNEVIITLTNDTAAPIENAFIVVDAGASGTAPARIILSRVNVAVGATESFSTNLFVDAGTRVSSWVMSEMPVSGPTFANMQMGTGYGIGEGSQIVVAN